MASSAGGGAGNAGPGDDSALNVLWMIAAVFILAIVIWWHFQMQLKGFFLGVRKYQLLGINLFFKILPLKFFNLEYLRDQITKALLLVGNTAPEDLSLDLAQYLSLIVGNYLRYPIILCLLIFSYFSFFKNPANKYTKTYNMHMLALQERNEWPQINPVLGLNLIEQTLNVGPWAMGRTPVEFCKEHNLILITAERHEEFKTGNHIIFKMLLDQDKALAIFIKQLGKLWHSPEALPIHQRALFAVFLARACREPKVANNLLRQINESSNAKNPHSLNFTGIDHIWPKYYKQRIIQEIVNAHAYNFTIFIDLLLLARQDGVLASADFLWLKPIDRLFWYILNSTGRQTYFAEAAGVHAHFLVEKSLGRALNVPYVGEAVKALQLALNEVIYVPTPEEKQELLAKM